MCVCVCVMCVMNVMCVIVCVCVCVCVCVFRGDGGIQDLLQCVCFSCDHHESAMSVCEGEGTGVFRIFCDAFVLVAITMNRLRYSKPFGVTFSQSIN